ncbi:GDSL-type esterase/lipase family protein [Promicromonospora kroppenstedtii]|uniref:GDSL-type esterase/lipase family protein n=1 Tax=Promicromonospora kroppenstedtii TaxID=440482 RepID=UPI00056439DC|nr:GDSL-type esterase/lipase family protein [Promicromonospora kroppenstedtii]
MTSAWNASWTQAVTDVTGTGLSFTDVTVRIRVAASIGGERLRVNLSNRFGSVPLLVGRAAVQVDGRASSLLFGGLPSAEIPPGGELVSDPASVSTTAGDAIDIDIYLPHTCEITTGNIAAATWCLSETGDHSGSSQFPGRHAPAVPLPAGGSVPAPTPLLRGVDVSRAVPAPVVVCLGDSITAAGWPERAAKRLRGRQIAIVNRGIGGNRLRLPGAGPMGALYGISGLERFDRDVLEVAGRTHVVVALGTNDLGHPGQVAPEDELPTAGQLIHALEEVGTRARDAGLSVFYASITPFLPAVGYDHEREGRRRSVNDWVRAQSGVLDFDATLRSDGAESELDPRYDSGDHLHPSDRGLDRIADVAAKVLGHHGAVTWS